MASLKDKFIHIIFLSFLANYLLYIYFYEFNQGISNAPFYIKIIKDLFIITYIAINFKCFKNLHKNFFALVALIPIAINTIYNTDLTQFYHNKNFIFSILIIHILRESRVKLKPILIPLATTSLFLGYFLLNWSPWDTGDMTSTVGNPASFYTLMLLFLSYHLNQTLKNQKLMNTILIFLSINAVQLSGSLGGQIILIITIGMFYFHQFISKRFLSFYDNIKISLLYLTSILTTYIYNNELFNTYLIKNLLNILFDFGFDLKSKSLSITNRASQFENLRCCDLINLETKYFLSDFQLFETLQNIGLVPALFLVILFFYSIIKYYRIKDFNYSYYLIIFLSLLFSPLLRYIPVSLVIIYLLNKESILLSIQTKKLCNNYLKIIRLKLIKV